MLYRNLRLRVGFGATAADRRHEQASDAKKLRPITDGASAQHHYYWPEQGRGGA
jgi:hypothetical protein